MAPGDKKKNDENQPPKSAIPPAPRQSEPPPPTLTSRVNLQEHDTGRPSAATSSSTTPAAGKVVISAIGGTSPQKTKDQATTPPTASPTSADPQLGESSSSTAAGSGNVIQPNIITTSPQQPEDQAALQATDSPTRSDTQTETSSEQEALDVLASPSSLDPNVEHNLHATMYDWQFPLENPIDTRLPANFDKSAKLVPYEGDGDDPVAQAEYGLQRAFQNLVTPQGIDAGLELVACLTGEALAHDPIDTRVTPWFISITVADRNDLPQIRDLHPEFIQLIEEHFKDITLRTLIRYRITDDVEYSGDPGDPATPNPPATSSKPKPLPPIYNSPKADPPFNTPESLKVIIDAFEVKLGPKMRPRVKAAAIPALWRENHTYQLPPKSIMGTGFAILDSDGKILLGTIGCFVYILDDTTGDYYRREDDPSQYQIFAMINAHCAVAKEKNPATGNNHYPELDLTAAAALQDKNVATHLPSRDRMNTHFSRKRRALKYQAKILDFDAIIKTAPANDGSAEYRAYQEACLLRPAYVNQLNADIAYARANPLENVPIGELFLCSGVRKVEVPAEHLGPIPAGKIPGKDLPQEFAVDYAFLKMYPAIVDQGQCVNKLDPELFPVQRDHPEGVDGPRATMEATDLGIAGEGGMTEPAFAGLADREVVMKFGGRSTGVNDGILELDRKICTRAGAGGSYECHVHPCQLTKPFVSKGDSGAAIINAAGHIVGIVCSGHHGEGMGRPIAILPMQVLRYDLLARYKLKIELVRTDLDKDPATIFQPAREIIGPHTFVDPVELLRPDTGAMVLGWDETADNERRFLVKTSHEATPIWCSWARLGSEWDVGVNDFLERAQKAVNAKRASRCPPIGLKSQPGNEGTKAKGKKKAEKGVPLRPKP